MNIIKDHLSELTAEKDMKRKLIIAVIYTTAAVTLKLEKHSGLRTPLLYWNSAVTTELSSEQGYGPVVSL